MPTEPPGGKVRRISPKEPGEVRHTVQHNRAMQTRSRTTPNSQLAVPFLDTSLISFRSPRTNFSDPGSDNSHSSSPWHDCQAEL